MDLLERLISIYEENEEKTIDEVLQTALKYDPVFSELSEKETVDLKRRFVNYIRSEEERSSYEELRERDRNRNSGLSSVSLSDDTSEKDEQCIIVNSSERRRRPHIKHVEAFVNNISVPKSLDELYKYFLDGNDAQNLVKEVINEGVTCWTSPKWAKWGDIVLFMHSKTANSTLTSLRTQVRKQLDPEDTVHQAQQAQNRQDCGPEDQSVTDILLDVLIHCVPSLTDSLSIIAYLPQKIKRSGRACR